MHKRRLGIRPGGVAAGLVAVQSGATTSHAASGPTWWKVDLTSIPRSAATPARTSGWTRRRRSLQNYNAVFLTDHDRGSGFQISGDNGNKISVPEKLNNNWTSKLPSLDPYPAAARASSPPR